MRYILMLVFILSLTCKTYANEDFVVNENEPVQNRIESFLIWTNGLFDKAEPGVLFYCCNPNNGNKAVLKVRLILCHRHIQCKNCYRISKELADEYINLWFKVSGTKLIGIYNHYDEEVFYTNNEGIFSKVEDWM